MNDALLWAAPRDQTRMRLLHLIRQSGLATRADLVKKTGFSRSTVGHSVNQLIASGLVQEEGFAGKGPGSGRGRPGLTLRPVISSGFVAAMDFGHRHVNVAIADELGSEIAHERLEVGLEAEEKLNAAVLALETLRIASGIGTVEQIVAGIPKPLNQWTGRVQTRRLGDGWGGLSPAVEIARRTGVPTHAENDAMLGAIGEHATGAAQGFGDFIYVKVAHGIGSSLFLNGGPYRAASGIVGSIAHCRLPGYNEPCRCGNRGCLEAVSSIGPIEAQLASTHPGMEPEEILGAMDDTAARVLNGAGRALGRVLADFCTLLGPSAVILGGSLASKHVPFQEGVSWAIGEFASPSAATTVEVLPAALGARAELLGGLALASQIHSERSVASSGAGP